MLPSSFCRDRFRPSVRLAHFVARWLWYVAAIVFLVKAAGADQAFLEKLFQPLQSTGQAVFAPDGQHVAYSAHQGDKATIVVVAVDRPDEKEIIAVQADDFQRQGRVTFLQWADAHRLIFGNSLSQVSVFDLETKLGRKLLDAEDLARNEYPTPAIFSKPRAITEGEVRAERLLANRTVPRTRTIMPTFSRFRSIVGDMEQVIVEAFFPGDGIHYFKLNIKTGKATEAASNIFGSTRLEKRLDDTESTEIAQKLSARFPGSMTEIRAWSEDRSRLLVFIAGPQLPGSYYVWLRKGNVLQEVVSVVSVKFCKKGSVV
jgi:hypothetical protein